MEFEGMDTMESTVGMSESSESEHENDEENDDGEEGEEGEEGEGDGESDGDGDDMDVFMVGGGNEGEENHENESDDDDGEDRSEEIEFSRQMRALRNKVLRERDDGEDNLSQRFNCFDTYSHLPKIVYCPGRDCASRHNIRQEKSLDSYVIGVLGARNKVLLCEVSDGWGKLHPNFLYSLKMQYSVQDFDISQFGWILLHNKNEVYWEEEKKVSHTGYLQCKCCYATSVPNGKFSYPLCSSMHHINSRCMWSCCGESWTDSDCVPKPFCSPEVAVEFVTYLETQKASFSVGSTVLYIGSSGPGIGIILGIRKSASSSPITNFGFQPTEEDLRRNSYLYDIRSETTSSIEMHLPVERLRPYGNGFTISLTSWPKDANFSSIAEKIKRGQIKLKHGKEMKAAPARRMGYFRGNDDVPRPVPSLPGKNVPFSSYANSLLEESMCYTSSEFSETFAENSPIHCKPDVSVEF